MSLSPNVRREWGRKALAMMLHRLGDQDIEKERFCPEDEPFCALPPTTWHELEALGYLEFATNITPMYYLTGAGWYKALEVDQQLESPVFREKLVRLTKVLKRYVNGRDEEKLVSLEEVARTACLSDSFVSNVMEAGVLDIELDQPGAEWADDRKDMIHVPVTFALSPINDI